MSDGRYFPAYEVRVGSARTRLIKQARLFRAILRKNSRTKRKSSDEIQRVGAQNCLANRSEMCIERGGSHGSFSGPLSIEICIVLMLTDIIKLVTFILFSYTLEVT